MSLVESKVFLQLASGILTAGAATIKAAAGLAGEVKTLSHQGLAVYNEINRSNNNGATTLQPALTIDRRVLTMQQDVLTLGRERGLPVQESLKVAALLSAEHYAAENPTAILQAMQTFDRDPTLAALKTFTHQLGVQQQPLVMRSIGLVIQDVSPKIGLPNTQIGTEGDGTLRVISTDDCGRALITEITATEDGEIALATEVTGISDSSCARVLDEFTKALAEAGVSCTQPDRKFTGGIADLDATKAFVSRQPVKQKQASTAPKSKSSAPPRRQVPKTQQNQQL
jgi:hypothetical protein